MKNNYEELLKELPHGVSIGKTQEGFPFASIGIYPHEIGFSGKTYLEVIEEASNYCNKYNLK